MRDVYIILAEIIGFEGVDEVGLSLYTVLFWAFVNRVMNLRVA
jgi:hypothetical protein